MSTYILFWNPSISSYTEERFLDDFYYQWGVGNWSIAEYENLKVGDTFYMIRCGEGNVGIVMKGVFTSDPYESSDWSPRQRRHIFYADIHQSFTINSFDNTPLLTPELLTIRIPDFNWFGGASGRLLTPQQAEQLEALWTEYLAENPNLAVDGQMFTGMTGC
ncbi:MAG: hypothetical protein NC111_07375 [Bacteroides sp.]|nr:hypothetical protein [Bacteroides sp.]MCM1414072.1 hypothetical protein [Bacteroides sp.]MCM1472329.1 hypothetical protein [Bacteroides sp.]